MAYRDPDLRSRYYSHTVTDTSIDRSIRKRINTSITSYLFITVTTVSIALCTSSTSWKIDIHYRSPMFPAYFQRRSCTNTHPPTKSYFHLEKSVGFFKFYQPPTSLRNVRSMNEFFYLCITNTIIHRDGNSWRIKSESEHPRGKRIIVADRRSASKQHQRSPIAPGLGIPRGA